MTILDQIITSMSKSGTFSKADKAAKKIATRKAKAEKSAAVQAANWEDRDGKARPTPERQAKGNFVLRDGELAGVTIAVDEAGTILDRLHRGGQITADQCQGGHDFAALLERTRLGSRGRSCLDFTPVGHDGDAEPTHAELRDTNERWRLHLQCGAVTWREMRRVCSEGEPARDSIRLRDGLDRCVAMWGKK